MPASVEAFCRAVQSRRAGFRVALVLSLGRWRRPVQDEAGGIPEKTKMVGWRV